MIYYLVILVILGVTGFNCYVRFKKSGRYASAIPGPSPQPLIGNMLDFDLSSQAVMWKLMRDLSDKYYPMTRVWMSTEALFSIRIPEDVEIFLTSQKAIEKGFTYKFLHPWLKTGLLTSKGKKWRQRRKILTPAFHFNILSKYMEITGEQGEILVKNLRANSKEAVHSLQPLLSKYTLNIICEAAMGVALDKIDVETVDKYKEAIYTIGEIAVYRMPRTYIHDWMLKLVPFLKINRDQKRALATVHDFTDRVVRERKEYHKRTDYKYLEGLSQDFSDADDVVHIGRKRRLAMLDLLLSLERDGCIDDAGIKEEVDTFTFEGHDTTAMAMTFILMTIAENQEAQDKARVEVSQIMDRSKGQVGVNEIQELHYLERCIKEALRLYPPVPTIFRRVEEDIKFTHGIVPDGLTIVCHFYDLHRDPNYWTEPDKFDPDRFLPEQCQERHPFAYVPFSAGPRNCIGQKFAMNELKSLTAQILYNFKLEPVERLKDIDLIADLVLRPSEPVHLKFIRIDRET